MTLISHDAAPEKSATLQPGSVPQQSRDTGVSRGATTVRLLDLAERMTAEFENELPAGTVARCLATCREELGDARLDAVESLARTRLRSLATGSQG